MNMRWLIGAVFTSFGLIPVATDSPVESQNSFKNQVDATDDQQGASIQTSMSIVDEPELGSELYVTVIDENTIAISLPDDVDETTEDSLQD